MNENDLIKQKDTEIDILIRKNARLKDEVSELRAEVERLTAKVDAAEDYLNPLPFKNAYDVAIETAKSEARKELAERLKEKSEHFELEKENYVSEEDIDRTLTELTERKEDEGK